MGIDYLSVAVYDDIVGPHVVLLGNVRRFINSMLLYVRWMQGVIAVEGLVLAGVDAGLYHLHCLPLRVVGADGAPARCILINK